MAIVFGQCPAREGIEAMGSQFAIAGAFLLSLAARHSQTDSGPIAGEYRMTAMDGNTLPCCAHSDTAGEVVSLAYGTLDLHEDGTYVWTVQWRYEWKEDSTTYQTRLSDFVISSGRYSFQADSLLMRDSALSAPITALVTEGRLTVIMQGHEYSFVRMPPTSPVGQWTLLRCHDLERRSEGCRRTDSSGVATMVSGGTLQIGYNVPAGRYRWSLISDRSYPDGTAKHVTEPNYSAGTYTWDGKVLSLTDESTKVGQITGVLRGTGRLDIRTHNYLYEFLRLVSLPTR